MVMPSRAGSETADVYATVARLAVEAADHGTFGVGAVLADDAGRIVAKARNAVIGGGHVHDPTAHAERQLVDWYFAVGPRDVAPGALTIVASLEPCMMCAGSILRAGFRCVALTDDEAAGVGIRRGLPTLSASLRPRAQSHFGSAAVHGRRAFVGEGAERFRGAMSTADFEAAMRAFDATREGVRKIAAGTRYEPSPSLDDAASDVVSMEIEPDVDAVWIGDRSSHGVRELLSIGQRLRGDGSVAALADATGRLLYVAAGCTGRSPIRTAVMECARGFTRSRPRLEQTFARALVPTDLTLFVAGPVRSEEEAIIALGASGSFVESPLPPGRPPFVQLVGATSSEAEWLAETLGRFPPFYRDFVGLRVGVAPATSA
jgi:cytosine deaminase